jgi:DNA-binding transcriptional regulator GbsR (MarR family)
MKALARNSDPETSHEAAASVNVTNLEAEVLAVLRANPLGLTVDELTKATGLEKVTVSPRMRPLCSKKLVKESGKAPGRSGRRQTIWMAT